MKRKLVALLPMKAHSERIPGKNFRDFLGKPLFRWMLDALLEVEEIGLIVINTDARRILEENGLTQGERVQIRDRRQELCGDHVSMNRIIADDIEAVPADDYLMTHTTNPLISGETIGRAISEYHQGIEDRGIDSLFSVNRVQTRFYRQDGTAINHDPDNLIRTQDLEPWYEENSCLYLFSHASFAATNARIGKRPLLFTTPRLESRDIDEPDDWALAVAAAGSLQRGRNGSHA